MSIEEKLKEINTLFGGIMRIRNMILGTT